LCTTRQRRGRPTVWAWPFVFYASYLTTWTEHRFRLPCLQMLLHLTLTLMQAGNQVLPYLVGQNGYVFSSLKTFKHVSLGDIAETGMRQIFARRARQSRPRSHPFHTRRAAASDYGRGDGSASPVALEVGSLQVLPLSCEKTFIAV